MPPTWTPTADEVKAVIPQRTNGLPFSENTIPTLADVESNIAQVVAEVQIDVAVIADDSDYADMAKWAATLGAAAYIEQGFFPEQNIDGGSIGAVLYQRYQDALGRLRRKVAADNLGDQSLYTTKTPSAVVADAPYVITSDLLP